MTCDENCQDALLIYADILSGVFCALAIIISAHQVCKHLKHYTNPFFQNRIMLIIFMAPVYALTSFLGVVTHDSQGYFALVRDIYEAVLIYAFFKLLSSYLAFEPESKNINYDRIYEMLSTKGVRPHIWPMNYFFRDLVLISHIRGQWFFRQCRLFILQYLAIKPTATLFLIIIYATSAPEVFSWFFSSIVFVSVSFSLYYLVLFYYTLQEELAYMKPLLKFLSVKSILFFTYWQDLVLDVLKSTILSAFGNVSDTQGDLLIGVIECCLVCFEMVVLSVMTTIAFSYKDFKDAQNKNWLLEDPGVSHLAKTFMTSVVSENFTTTLEDLKDLGSPMKDPFRSYRSMPAEVKTESRNPFDLNYHIQEDSDVLKEQYTQIHEKPIIIPGFIKK